MVFCTEFVAGLIEVHILTQHYLFIILGLVALVGGGDRFVVGAAAFARNVGIPPLMVGLTIVAFGTSAPEIFVSAFAAFKGNPGIALGNAIGSNITNIGLVVGLTVLLFPLKIHSGTLKREYPLLLLIMVVVAGLLWNGMLNRMDGILLTAGAITVVGLMIYWGLEKHPTDPMAKEYADEIPTDMKTSRAILWIIVGLILLPLGSELMVTGSVAIARHFGISDTIIGLTIVAVGTSLPELIASLMGAIRGEHDIAIGNILGSNMFNLLAVIGIPCLIHPFRADPNILFRDYPVMLLLTVLLYGFSYFHHHRAAQLGRLSGCFLLTIYICYMSYLGVTIGKLV